MKSSTGEISSGYLTTAFNNFVDLSALTFSFLLPTCAVLILKRAVRLFNSNFSPWESDARLCSDWSLMASSNCCIILNSTKRLLKSLHRFYILKEKLFAKLVITSIHAWKLCLHSSRCSSRILFSVTGEAGIFFFTQASISSIRGDGHTKRPGSGRDIIVDNYLYSSRVLVGWSIDLFTFPLRVCLASVLLFWPWGLAVACGWKDLGL